MGVKMHKILTKEEWSRRKRKKRWIGRVILLLLILSIIGLSVLLIDKVWLNNFATNQNGKEVITETLSNGVIMKQEYLTPNEYSRPQTKLKRINGVVIHYTANPGTSAENNRSYFEGLSWKKTTYASSHYVIGLEGEIIQCIPLTEIAYASNERNNDTISIEGCHEDETGKFNEETYQSLVDLTAALCLEYKLEAEQIIRHYDVTGKLCPLYFVEHEDAWVTFKDDVVNEVKQLKAVVK